MVLGPGGKFGAATTGTLTAAAGLTAFAPRTAAAAPLRGVVLRFFAEPLFFLSGVELERLSAEFLRSMLTTAGAVGGMDC